MEKYELTEQRYKSLTDSDAWKLMNVIESIQINEKEVIITF